MSQHQHLVDALLYDAVGAACAALSPALAVGYPSVAFSPPSEAVPGGGGRTRPKPYVLARVVPNTSELDGIAYDSQVNLAGLLTLNITHPTGQGLIKPVKLAGSLVPAFKPGTVLAGSGVVVRIHEQPTVRNAIVEGELVTVPVVTRWVAAVPGNT